MIKNNIGKILCNLCMQPISSVAVFGFCQCKFFFHKSYAMLSLRWIGNMEKILRGKINFDSNPLLHTFDAMDVVSLTLDLHIVLKSSTIFIWMLVVPIYPPKSNKSSQTSPQSNYKFCKLQRVWIGENKYDCLWMC